jgi:hypothetical protein
MKRPLTFHINHPLIGTGLYIKLIYTNALKNHIPKTKESDIEEIMAYINQYKKDNYYDFNGLLLSTNGFNLDLFFNVIYPHLQAISYSKPEIEQLFKEVKKKWKSVAFYSDNFLYLVNKNAIIAHGVTYFFNDCRIKSDDIVIDLGASPGDFSALAIYHGAQKVFCFDPDKSSNLAETSTLHNGRIEVVPKFVSDKTHSNLSTTIDKFCTEKSLTQLNFIKMDIEGAELLALEGAKEAIKKFQPKMSICVYHDLDHSSKIKSFIKTISSNYCFESLGPVLYCTPK